MSLVRPVKVVAVSTFTNGAIQLHLSGKQAANKEAYQLTASPGGINISADSAAGVFYGIQTLLQLLPKEIESKSLVGNTVWTIPAISITDYPRFAWRGVMLDVSRILLLCHENPFFESGIGKRISPDGRCPM